VGLLSAEYTDHVADIDLFPRTFSKLEPIDRSNRYPGQIYCTAHTIVQTDYEWGG